MIQFSNPSFTVFILLIALAFCCPKDEEIALSSNLISHKDSVHSKSSFTLKINENILVEDYFGYMDSIVKKYDAFTAYKLSEHLLVRSNPWIIDTLQNTDYYRMKARDSFVYNQKKMIVLPKGASLTIPNSNFAEAILDEFQRTLIDINIPEYKLRIYKDSVKLYEFPVRVGKNEKKYLEMSGRVEDLKTKTGEGCVVHHVLNPRYVNPVNNHEYFETKRDDGKKTKLPQIPFIETEINGVKNGQLIHPTTNPITLGRAYSNGCIGTREADAWVIYYYAPIDTKIKIKYDLIVLDDNGEKIVLEDIYNKRNR